MLELSKSWMQADPAEAGYLYVDGHVRVYDGEVAKLPRRFVSRERLRKSEITASGSSLLRNTGLRSDLIGQGICFCFRVV